ncbi:hypothetical protein EDEG_02461 [Edhazardia aedis USNM 41457]|uniref:Ankyrin repeat protein n=1 Tax=Edhazardia aedis (strain USNM 41457) TaxID=1003232 RepID=J9D5V1_EDHAE|nr:hypothetical protein EDEG_02461 [Edhazardia aedis USNM 41457]|eukprot:EJW03156.1 hypothetical protein EDEG_02461 [Edhazardia aedis USNM 41457]
MDFFKNYILDNNYSPVRLCLMKFYEPILFDVIKNKTVIDLMVHFSNFNKKNERIYHILNAKNEDGENCITFAAKLEKHDMIRVLVKLGQKIENIEIKDCRRRARRVFNQKYKNAGSFRKMLRDNYLRNNLF